MPLLVFNTARPVEHRAVVVKELINNGGSPITIRRAFRVRSTRSRLLIVKLFAIAYYT